MQAIDPAPYRGHVVRFRAAARLESTDEASRAQLWMRVDRPDGQMGFFNNMADRPIRSDKWNYFEIVGLIDTDAEKLNIGMILIRKGSAWIDDVSITDIGKPVSVVDPPRALSKQKLGNVITFTRRLGYIRHFYPGDEANSANWDATAVDGMRVIENADDSHALAKQLEDMFRPIAPNLRVFPTASKTTEADSLTAPSNYRELRLMSYRHTVFGQGRKDSPYSTERPAKKVGELADQDPIRMQRPFHADLGGGVSCMFPRSVFPDDNGTLPRGTYKRDIDREPLLAYTANDRATRLADVALAWNVFQHFYPSFDIVKVDWNRELRTALTTAATDADDLAFLRTMQLIMAKLQDGHGGIYNLRDQTRYSLPVVFRLIGGDGVIMNNPPDVPNGPRAGDVLVRIDGKPAKQVVADLERYISAATPQWRRFRAMEMLRLGPKDSTATLEIKSGSEKPRTVVLQRDEKSESLSETRPSKIDELRPGIFYVDLDRISDDDFKSALSKLANAKGIIFDLRGYPRVSPVVISHLIDKPVGAARWNVPIITEPDRSGTISYNTNGRWDLRPEAPRLTAKIAFITDGRAISYAESYMGIIEAYKLAAIVGETTAGTNGDVNPLTLPGGYSVY